MNLKFETINFEIIENIAIIRLNRPNSYNSLNAKMAKELLEISYECDTNKKIRAIILTGEGDKAFCAGGDLKSFHETGNVAKHLKMVTHDLHGAITKFSRMNSPLIVAVNGVAAGAGLSFVGFADLAIATSSATFVSAYTKAGLTPDGSSSYYLPRIIGIRKYLELVMTNKVLSSEEALAWGLLNKVYDDKKFWSETLKLAENLSKGPTLAYGKTKRLVHNSLNSTLETQMELETKMIAESAETNDGQKGIQAFLKKEKPNFEGK